ncbi:MAG: anti-sigma regulatory factor [Deltaproteobacteria bacterium]|nr:anti-sigma regulatory factor [Deltaproteobacteria bacterium]
MRGESSEQVLNGQKIFEELFIIEGGNFNKAGEVASRIKVILKNMGIPDELVRRAALVAYESEINIVSYAKQGYMKLTVNPDLIMIESIDEGEGIVDIELAMQEGYSTANDRIREMGFGAGMGLCNIKNYSDYFDLRSKIGKGTYLKMIIESQQKNPKTE